MGVIVSDNFDPKVPKFLDDRQSFKTLRDMKAFDTNLLPDGFETYCVQTDKKYKYLSTNISRLDTGKWREITSSGSSVLQSDLTFTKDVGYVTKGTVYGAGTPIEDILRDMAYKELVGEALTYYGYFDCNATGVAVTNPTVDQIKALNSEAVGTKEFSFYIENMDYGQIVYAIPKSFGGLTKIIVDSTFNYLTSSFTITEMVIDGIDYKVYFLTDCIGLSNKVLVECS